MDYLKEYARMCAAHEPICDSCPLADFSDKGCPNILVSNLPEAKQIIAAWAKEHPEPVYPSLNEWWRSKYPNAAIIPCYGHFMPKSDYYRDHCVKWECEKCGDRPMTAEIAAKLGVEAKEGVE